VKGWLGRKGTYFVTMYEAPGSAAPIDPLKLPYRELSRSMVRRSPRWVAEGGGKVTLSAETLDVATGESSAE
jgi:hypothetical protein